MDKIQPTIDIHGTKRCYQNGVPHRDNDQPAIKWYQKGELHRNNDQPAVIEDGNQFWYVLKSPKK